MIFHLNTSGLDIINIIRLTLTPIEEIIHAKLL